MSISLVTMLLEFLSQLLELVNQTINHALVGTTSHATFDLLLELSKCSVEVA